MAKGTKRRDNEGKKNSHQDLKKNGLVYEWSKDSEGIKRCKCAISKGLHNFNCLPSHLRSNRFIHTGYRMNLSTWQCFKSLFYFHNESFNIYSHGKNIFNWAVNIIIVLILLCIKSWAPRSWVRRSPSEISISCFDPKSFITMRSRISVHIIL